MFYAPDSSFEIRTHFGREIVVRILKENVERAGILPPLLSNAPFTGKVSFSEFNIRESSLLYRFLPKFRGDLEDFDGGTALKVDAVNGWARSNVVLGYLASLLALVGGSIQNLLKHDYWGTAGSILCSVIAAAITVLAHRFYDRKLREGRRKLTSLFHDDDDGASVVGPNDDISVLRT